MKTTHTPNLDALDPFERAILDETLTALLRLHPITPPVAPVAEPTPRERALAAIYDASVAVAMARGALS